MSKNNYKKDITEPASTNITVVLIRIWLFAKNPYSRSILGCHILIL